MRLTPGHPESVDVSPDWVRELCFTTVFTTCREPAVFAGAPAKPTSSPGPLSSESMELVDTLGMRRLHEKAGDQHCILRGQVSADDRAVGTHIPERPWHLQRVPLIKRSRLQGPNLASVSRTNLASGR